RRRAHGGDHRGRAIAGGAGRRPCHRPGFRGRGIRGADQVRHHRAGPAPGAPGARSPPGGRRSRAGAGRAAAGRDAGRGPVHLPRHRLDLRAGQRGRAEAARGGRAVDRGLPGHGVPARPGRGDRRAQRGVAVRPAAGRAGRRDRRGRRNRLDRRGGPAGRAGPGAAGRGRGGAGPRIGPGPPAQPGPLGHPRYSVIIVVCLNPALDVTHHLDAVDWGGVNRPRTVPARPGGKGLNVARTLQALGVDVLVLGLAGGITGAGVEAGLRERCVPAAFTPVAGETRRTFSVVEGSVAGRGVTAFHEAGPEVGEEELARFRRGYEQALEGASAVVLSGSLPPGLQAGTYATLIETATAADVPAVLDTHGEALRRGAAAGAAIVKPNLAELAALAGRPLAPAAGGPPDGAAGGP